MSKKGSKENPITQKDLLHITRQKGEISYEILNASLKDDFCNFTYKVTGGIGLGSVHNVKDMPGIIKDELREAFVKFNVHLAVIDEIFKSSNIEIKDVDMMHTHEHTTLYNVTAFKIKGGKSNETIVLTGNKFVSIVAGRIELETPAVSLDNLSNYKWYNELKTAADEVRKQVSLYKEGNYIPVKEQPDENQEEEQQNLFSKSGHSSITDEDFESGKKD